MQKDFRVKALSLPSAASGLCPRHRIVTANRELAQRLGATDQAEACFFRRFGGAAWALRFLARIETMTTSLMSWVTVIWSMVASACLTLAVISFGCGGTAAPPGPICFSLWPRVHSGLHAL